MEKVATLNNSNATSTSQNLSEKFHVSERTIRNDAQFAEAIDTIREAYPEIAQKILAKEKIRDQKPVTKKKVLQIAKKLEEKMDRHEPLPRTQEKILELADEEGKKNFYSKENVAQKENLSEITISTCCKVSLLSLLEEILEHIQMVKSHHDFPHETAGEKIKHVEQEVLSIVNLVSANF